MGIHRRVIRGEPIRVGQKQIVPEAQVTWWMQHGATIGMASTFGSGGAIVSIRPRALIEQTPGGERRIPIQDRTIRLLAGLAAGAVFVLFLAQVAEQLGGRRGGSK